MNEKIINDVLAEIEKYELDLIEKIIFNEKLLSNFTHLNNINDDLINYLLINTSKKTVYSTIHDYIVFQLINYYFLTFTDIEIDEIKSYFSSYKCYTKLHELKSLNYTLLKNLKVDELLIVLERLHIIFLNSQVVYKKNTFKKLKSKINLKIRGAVYTPNKVAKDITINTINNQLKKGVNKQDLKILDFGCGTGHFYTNAYEYLTNELYLNPHEIIKNNLFGVDVDSTSLDILKVLIIEKIPDKNITDLKNLNDNILCKNALLNKKELIFVENALDSKNDFKNNKIGFNVIIGNPPYFLLKINKKDKNQYIQNYYSEIKKELNKELNYYRKSGSYSYSIEGMLNYYKISIERIINIANKDAEIGLICPSTLFGDVSSKKLRKWIISSHKLREIYYYPESEKIFEDISQSTVIFYMNKNGTTEDILINIDNSSFKISLKTILEIFGEDYEIAYINEVGWNILNKLSKFKKIKEIPYIRNKRGELDLTLHKHFITKNKTNLNLIRGNMIGKDTIKYNDKEFVLDKFIDSKSEDYLDNDYNKKRLICQQISNIDKNKRLNFVFCKSNDILGNSCNYINLLNHDENDFENLKIILNSYLLNWRFKITSSNNHINNYEIDQLPLIDLNALNLTNLDILKQNIEICKLYDLNKEESLYVLEDFFEKKDIEQEWGE